MTDQRWLYWLSDPAWWLGASQGVVGALVGFIGLFFAYRIARKGDRKKRAEEQAQVDVADIMQMVLVLRNKQSYEIQQDEIWALETKLMLFYVHQLQDRPQTAKWARSEAAMLRFRHTNQQFGIAAVRQYSMTIVDNLTDWLGGGRREGKLRAKTAEEAINQWNKLIARYEDAPSILDVSTATQSGLLHNENYPKGSRAFDRPKFDGSRGPEA